MALELNKIRSSQINEKVNVGTVESPILAYDIILPETRADLVKETFGAKASKWEAQKSYKVGETVYIEDASGAIASYECVKAHTSGNSFSDVSGTDKVWNVIVSRRFVTPADEIAWSEGGIALKYRGSYSASYEYKANDLVVFKNGETGKEEYFIALQNTTGVAPSLEGDSAVWKNLNLYANHADVADKVKVSSNPALLDEQDEVLLTFVTENGANSELYSNAKLVYEVNKNYLHVMSEYADKYMKAYDSDGNAITPEAKSINDEFKAIYAALKTVSGGNLVLGHGLTIKLNGEVLIDSWKAEKDSTVDLQLTNESITNWEAAMNEAFASKGDTKYVRYDAEQDLDEAAKAQARANIDAAPVANYAIMDNNNKIKLENLPETVVGGLQYKGTYDASVAGSIVPEMGDYYIVEVAGNYDPAGNAHVVENGESTYFRNGDWAIYNGTEKGWAKIDNTDAVKTVNGQIGDVKTYRGLYSGETQYYAGDWVLVDGILYLAVQASKGQDPKAEGSVYWQVAGRIYEGKKGIVIDGNKIGHSNVLTTEAEEAADVVANGGQFSVDVNEYDEEGHVVKTKKQNITLSQTWREVKVGETVVVAANSNEALNVAGNAPITVEGADNTVYVKHNEGVEVKDAIDLTVADNGQVIANVVSSDKYGHVNGTRELKLANLAMKDGNQTLSGIKTLKNTDGIGAVILPETTEVYDLGSINAKFANVYANNFNGALKGNADTATKWAAKQQFTINLDSGLDKNNSNLISSALQNVDGSGAATWNVSLADSGIKEGVYTAVKVNKKGIVVAGGNMIEFGHSTTAEPSEALVVGGLFFRMVESN